MDRKKLSNKHEKDIAEALNGKVQIASGAIPLVGMKGDRKGGVEVWKSPFACYSY